MKIKINFLSASTAIIFSCNNLSKDIILNTYRNNSSNTSNRTGYKNIIFKKKDVSKDKERDKILRSDAESLEIICSICNKELKSLIIKNINDIIAHNLIDYRFKTDSLSNSYSDRWSKQASYNKTFFFFFDPFNDHSDWRIKVKDLFPVPILSKSPKVISKCIQLLHINREIKVDIHSKSNLLEMSPLDFAICFSNEEILKLIIQWAPLIHKDEKSRAINFPDLLRDAIASGRKEIVKVVIDAGADPNALYNGNIVGQNGNALMLAELYDQKDIAIYLIENNLIKDLNQEDTYGQTALMRIARSRYPGWSKILYRLLEKGADIKKKDKDGYDVLMHLLKRINYINSNITPTNFIGGYNLSSSAEAKDIFDRVCNDKEEMLRHLYVAKRSLINKARNRNSKPIYFKKLF